MNDVVELMWSACRYLDADEIWNWRERQWSFVVSSIIQIYAVGPTSSTSEWVISLSYQRRPFYGYNFLGKSDYEWTLTLNSPLSWMCAIALLNRSLWCQCDPLFPLRFTSSVSVFGFQLTDPDLGVDIIKARVKSTQGGLLSLNAQYLGKRVNVYCVYWDPYTVPQYHGEHSCVLIHLSCSIFLILKESLTIHWNLYSKPRLYQHGLLQEHLTMAGQWEIGLYGMKVVYCKLYLNNSNVINSLHPFIFLPWSLVADSNLLCSARALAWRTPTWYL